ncbi:MAG: STAS domain-containing protein [Gemmatimonadetes bacterium]|nr:STAS domain-containing protein [Gemmatimonadota bacterium]MXY83353.1 STAS domain-containing protein [Gemmatimonadota bacterium]MYA22200.1 STAS domain-containing protein [Gemmatimonadota bacterium]MYB69447.1 STAS domain-containing protein [Gemmatimonadota bacterium]
MSVQVKWERKDGILIAMLIGHIDSSNADRFQRIVESGIDAEDQALILDFERVFFISSAGLRVSLVISRKFNESGKKFGVCTLSDPIRNVLAISGFDQIIPIYESRDAAINAFESS